MYSLLRLAILTLTPHLPSIATSPLICYLCDTVLFTYYNCLLMDACRVSYGASLSVQNTSSTPQAFLDNIPPRFRDHSLMMGHSSAHHRGLPIPESPIKYFCGVLVSRRGGITSASLDRWNAILCSPPKRITTRGHGTGRETLALELPI